MWVVYILYSSSLRRFYIGCSHQLPVRLEQHANGVFKNSFTSKAKDWELKFVIDCLSESQARCIEAHIKRMKSSTYILNLIAYPEMKQSTLNLCIIPKNSHLSFPVKAGYHFCHKSFSYSFKDYSSNS